MIDKKSIINYLKKHKENFKQNYKIDKIGLFGSFSIDKHNNNSDIDILYKTSSKGLTFSQLLKLEDELKSFFNKKIDLVDFDYMNPLIKKRISKDIIYV